MKAENTRVGSADGGFVLPRPLRKPVRHFLRLMNGGFRVTRRGLMVFGLMFAVTAGTAGLLTSPRGDQLVSDFSLSMGIAIDAYDISGNLEVSDIEILQLLSPRHGTSILAYDVEAARQALKANPWIADAVVSKVYPNKLAIRIDERKPFALWQNEHGLQLIDRSGIVLAAFDGRAGQWPVVVGKGANGEAANMISLLQKVPDLASNTKALIRVGDRRWDIETMDGVTILLPEENPEAELVRFAELDRETELLLRDVTRIDLRFKDRMIVKMSEGASEAVRTKRGEQMKALATSLKGRNT